MKVRTYNEWRDMLSKEIAPDEEIECPECYGFGETECDHCGSYVDCDVCDTKGTVLAGEVSIDEIKDSLTRAKYEQALLSDLTDLADWESKDRNTVYVNHGFSVYSRIESHTEVVELRR